MRGRRDQSDSSELSTLGGDDTLAPSARDEPDAIDQIRSIGRYVVFEQIGQGGMGRVLRAYDPKLEREVALKILRGDMLDERYQARLVREARAMARLSHPNVVAVYDVDDSPHGVVLVMEHVRGQTLRAWLRERSRSWDQIIARFIEAGRGLAAAHLEALLHRDFKCSNVLIPESGPAKVTDFGLAKLVSGPAPFATVSLSAPTDDPLVTREGMVLGTPLYMAPEQQQGDIMGPAVDQYAFCVTLWEALTGRFPFTGSWSELKAKKREGPPPWPAGVPLPRPIVEALRRGLAPEPHERWPGMSALLEALSFDPARRRRQRLMLAGGLGLLGAGGLAATAIVRERAAQCSGARAQLEGVWDDERRVEIESTLLETQVLHARPTWAFTRVRLDEYADDWAATYTESCEATTIRGEQSPRVMDLRMACLDRARGDLRAIVDVLAAVDDQSIHGVHRIVDGLPALDRCAAADIAEAEQAPPPDDEAEAVEAVRDLVSQSKALASAGRYPDARTVVEHAEAKLESLEYEPVAVELALQRGSVLEALGEYEASERSLRSALELGIRSRYWPLVQRASSGLLFLLGARIQDVEHATRYRELALELATDPRSRAAVHNSLGAIARVQGQYEVAAAEHRESLDLLTAAFGPADLTTAPSRNNLAHVLLRAGKYEQAAVEYQRALEIRQAQLGPEHPLVATSRGYLGMVLEKLGRFEQAETELRQAITSIEGVMGPEHDQVASMRHNLANVLYQRGQHSQAEAEFRRVIALQGKNLGPEHSNIAYSRTSLGNCLLAQGRYVEAEAEFRRALDVWRERLGPRHPNVVGIASNLGRVLIARGKHREAEFQLRGALAIQAELLGGEHPDLANSHLVLGMALREQGRYTEAEAELRRGLDMQARTLGAEHPDVATAHDELARLLHRTGRYEQAHAELRRALSLHERLIGPEHDDSQRSRSMLARTLLALDRPAEALPLARRAWTHLDRDDVLPQHRALAAFVLAQAQWRAGGDRARARAHAERAAALYDRMETRADEADEVSAWLREPS